MPTNNSVNLSKVNNLLEIFFDQCDKQKKNDLFLNWLKFPEKVYTWDQTNKCILQFSSYLKKYIQKGDRCLLVFENRPEWLISDLSIMLSGGITVPSYTTYTEKDYEYIIKDCEPSIIIISNKTLYKKLKNIIFSNNFIKKVILFDEMDENNLSNKISYLKNIFKNNSENYKNNLNVKLNRKDLACIIYTSGTGGNPKGVMLSHGGILNNCEGGVNLIKTLLSKRTRFLTWLPLSHSYEHTVQFIQISVGAKIYYAESIEKLIKNMSDCKPEIMTAVPRFYQNLYQKINSNFKRVCTYTTYSHGTEYFAYTSDIYNDYVKFTDNVASSATNGKTLLWKVRTSSVNVPPAHGDYWERGDLCSKTMDGCKMRFGYNPLANTANQLAKTSPDTTAVLPFGGFPASKAFK